MNKISLDEKRKRNERIAKAIRSLSPAVDTELERKPEMTLSEYINKYQEERIRETVSSIIHDIWAHWMRYLFSASYRLNDDVLIPKKSVERWKRQMDTPYAKLSESEKDSDREQADKIISALKEWGMMND